MHLSTYFLLRLKGEPKATSPDKEKQNQSKLPRNLPPLPNYFDKENFLIYGDFEPIVRRRLVRYITAYNG